MPAPTNISAKRCCCSIYAVCGLFLGLAVESAPFQNGGFEQPKKAAGRHYPVQVGSWVVTRGSIAAFSEMLAGGTLAPIDGTQMIGLGYVDVIQGDTISQEFDTVIGMAYKVGFYLGWYGNPSTNPGLHVRAEARSVSGESLAMLDVAPPHLQSWGPLREFTFVATTPTTTLSFRDISATSFQADMVLDAVAVAELGMVVTIRTQPTHQQVPYGGTAVFTVTAQGGPPLSYQWFFNNFDVPGATNSSLVIENVRQRDSGDYHAAVRNAFMEKTTRLARLVAGGAETRTSLAVELELPTQLGETNKLLVSKGVGTMNWEPLVGHESFLGTGRLVSRAVSIRAADCALFRLEGLTSDVRPQLESLEVPLPGAPLVVEGPEDQHVRLNGRAAFGVTVSGGEGPYQYQWYFNDSLLPNENASTLVWDGPIRIPIELGHYRVVVSAADGQTAESRRARLDASPYGLKIFEAAEVEFRSESGKTYRLLGSADFQSWLPLPGYERIPGNGDWIRHCVRTRGTPYEFFYAEEQP